MNNIYEATKLIGDTYSEQIKNQSLEVIKYLVHKLKHTFGVSYEIMNIFYAEKDLYSSFSDTEKELVELSGILHDLGRFYQHSDGHILDNHIFNHGKYAVDLLSKIERFNNPILLFAIESHNGLAINYDNPFYKQLSEQDKYTAMQIAKLLRDADKLENIKFFIYNGMPALVADNDKGTLSDSVKEALKNHKQVDYKIIQTKSDRVTNGLSWINDIYFDSTKKIIKDIGFIEKGIQVAKLYGATEQDCEFLKKVLVI